MKTHSKTLALISYFFVCLGLPFHLFAQTDSNDLHHVADLLRAQQFQQADEVSGRLLQISPHDCRLLSLQGMALNGLQKLHAAKQTFEAALTYCPNDLLALEGAAQIAYAYKQPDAVVLLNRVLAIRPDSVTTHAMLAALYRFKGECSSALPQFKASVSLFAAHPQLQRGYAFCLGTSGRYSESAENYRQILASDPDATVRYDLALMQWRSGNAKIALNTLQPLLQGSTDEQVLDLGARLAEEQGDTPLAVRCLRAAILSQPKNAENYLNFAQIAFNHRSYKVGIDMVNTGLTQLPKDARLYVARGVLEVQISQLSRAVEDFRRAHKLQPQLSLAMDAIGIMQSQQQESTAALKLFEKEVSLHPNDSLLQYLYAEALSQSELGGDTLQKAIAAAKKSILIDPQYEPARNLLALLFLHANQPRLALTASLDALKIEPDDQAALYQEIMARRRLGQSVEVSRLVGQLAELRKTNAQRKKENHRYVLQDDDPQ